MTNNDARSESIRREARRRIGAERPEGRERPQANAIKLGLAEESPRVPEDAANVHERSRLWYYPLKPQHAFHAWIVDQISTTSLRIERAGRMERRMRDRAALRAESSWEIDRRVEVETIGAGLAKAPSATVKRLRRTLQGVEWLMERWAMLARAADLKDGAWDEPQRRLAFDLLGTPPECREAAGPGHEIDGQGHPLVEAPPPAVLARAQVAALDALRDDLADADAIEQSLAEADLAEPTSPEFRGVRRQEAALFSRLRWLLAQIRTESPFKSANPRLLKYFDPDGIGVEFAATGPTPGYVPVAAPKPEPAPEPAPEPVPEPVPEPEEEGEDLDHTAVIATLGVDSRPRRIEPNRRARRRERSRRKG